MSRIYLPTFERNSVYRSMQYELWLQKLCAVAHFSALTKRAAARNSFRGHSFEFNQSVRNVPDVLVLYMREICTVFRTKSRTRNLTPVTRAKTQSLVTAVIVKLNRGRRNCTATLAVNFRPRLYGNFVCSVLSVGVHYVLYLLNCADLGCAETVLYV
jgi:hypothetical protein